MEPDADVVEAHSPRSPSSFDKKALERAIGKSRFDQIGGAGDISSFLKSNQLLVKRYGKRSGTSATGSSARTDWRVLDDVLEDPTLKAMLTEKLRAESAREDPPA